MASEELLSSKGAQLEALAVTGSDFGTSGRRELVHRGGKASAIVALSLLTILALVLRLLRRENAYGLFIDEATYARIAQSVAHGEGIALSGEPFTLHPPLGFLVLGAAARASGTENLLDLVMDLRYVTAAFGALAVGLGVLLLRSAGLGRWAYLGGLLLALDPFALSFDGRLMLESIAQVPAFMTVLLCSALASRPSRTPRLLLTGIALAGATTFATKETFGLVLLAALVLQVLLDNGIGRRRAAVAAVGTVAGYLAVNVVVVFTTSWNAWWTSRVSGLLRLVGTDQETGFNADHVKVSLWSRAAADLTQFAPSYVALAVGGAAGGLLLHSAWRRRPLLGRLLDDETVDRVVPLAAWTVAACCYLAYAVTFGSIEEQMFYIPLAPCVMMFVVCLAAAFRARRPLRVVGAVLTVTMILVQGAQYLYVRSTPDDAYVNFLAWAEGLPANSRIDVTEEVAQFVLTGQELGQWSSVDQLREEQVEYVLVAPDLAAHGYGLVDEAFIDQLKEHAELVGVFPGRSDQGLFVYDVRSWDGETA